MGKGCLEYIYTYKLLKDKVKCKNIRLTLKCASITTMTTDFYSVSVLSNKLELLISRVINLFNLTGEIEVIISARDKDQIIIAMYVYILHSDVYLNYTIRLYTSYCFVFLLPC